VKDQPAPFSSSNIHFYRDGCESISKYRKVLSHARAHLEALVLEETFTCGIGPMIGMDLALVKVMREKLDSLVTKSRKRAALFPLEKIYHS
jgi:hypothetical protein